MLPATFVTERLAFKSAYDMVDAVARFHAMFQLDHPPLVSLGTYPDAPRSLQPDEVAMYLWQEHMRANSVCYALSERASSDLVGTHSVLVPDPSDLTPWIGILLISAQHRRKGYGSGALNAVHGHLLALGWSRIGCAIDVGQPSSWRDRRFLHHW